VLAGQEGAVGNCTNRPFLFVLLYKKLNTHNS
jgi:hypothetical protein